MIEIHGFVALKRKDYNLDGIDGLDPKYRHQITTENNYRIVAAKAIYCKPTVAIIKDDRIVDSAQCAADALIVYDKTAKKLLIVSFSQFDLNIQGLGKPLRISKLRIKIFDFSKSRISCKDYFVVLRTEDIADAFKYHLKSGVFNSTIEEFQETLEKGNKDFIKLKDMLLNIKLDDLNLGFKLYDNKQERLCASFSFNKNTEYFLSDNEKTVRLRAKPSILYKNGEHLIASIERHSKKSSSLRLVSLSFEKVFKNVSRVYASSSSTNRLLLEIKKASKRDLKLIDFNNIRESIDIPDGSLFESLRKTKSKITFFHDCLKLIIKSKDKVFFLDTEKKDIKELDKNSFFKHFSEKSLRDDNLHYSRLNSFHTRAFFKRLKDLNYLLSDASLMKGYLEILEVPSLRTIISSKIDLEVENFAELLSYAKEYKKPLHVLISLLQSDYLSDPNIIIFEVASKKVCMYPNKDLEVSSLEIDKVLESIYSEYLKKRLQKKKRLL